MSHIDFMRVALEEAKVAFDEGEVPVGAVIVKDKQVVAKAHNLIESDCDPTAHAEIIAIKGASKKLNSWRLDDCSLYVTLEPCTMCIGAIRQARISEIYFGAFDEKFGACGSLYDLSGKVKINSELGAKESVELLGEFFRKLR